MGFLGFMRDMFVFDRLFGKHRKGGIQASHTDNYTAYDCNCDCDNDDTPTCSSDYSCSSWDDGNYVDEDYHHDSHDDCAHDYDDFDDDF